MFKSIFSDNCVCYFQSLQSSACRQKELKLKSNLALTLGYLNRALNNSAFNINVHVFDLYTLFTRKRLWPRPHELADILENRYFYPRHSLPSTRKRRFRATKTQVFKHRLQPDFFFKGQLLIYVKRRFSDTMTYHTVY